MNEILKRICPLAAIICFVLCITGALGIVNTATETEWKLTGIFFTGVAIFVPFVLLGVSVLCSQNKGGNNKKYAVRDDRKRNQRTNKTAKTVTNQKTEPAGAADVAVASDAGKDQKEDSIELKRDNGKQLPEDTGPTTLYICNLVAEINENDLKEEFEVFGEVRSVKLISDKDGQPKGYAFVEMANKAEAALALDDINGQQLKGQEVRVSYARRKGNKRRRS